MRKCTLLFLAFLVFFTSAICVSGGEYYYNDAGDFKNKVWLVIGDSISEHNNRAKKNYDDYIAEWLNVKVINVARSGTGYLQSFQDAKAWIDQVNSLPEHVDFITVMGGLNDMDFPIGDADDQGRETLYGGLHLFYQSLIDKYPHTPIGVITSPPRYNRFGENGIHVQYIDTVLEVAHEYPLAILDLYRQSGLKPWEAAYRKEYFSSAANLDGDGVHPNEKAQLIIAYQVCDFIKNELGVYNPFRNVFGSTYGHTFYVKNS